MHYAYISTILKMILDELSLLSSQRFEELFKIIMSKDIGSKALLLNAYQIIYRKEFPEDMFLTSMRNHFQSEAITMRHFEAKPLHWNGTLSRLYNPEEVAEEIRVRYSKNFKKTSMTLEKIKQIPEFIDKVNDLRKSG